MLLLSVCPVGHASSKRSTSISALQVVVAAAAQVKDAKMMVALPTTPSLRRSYMLAKQEQSLEEEVWHAMSSRLS
jgi:hypothetical protein